MGAALGGSSVRLAGNAHHPGHSLRDQVVAGPHGVRTGLPEAGDAGVDNARVYLPKCFVVHAELLRNLGTIVLDDHVRLAGEAVEDLTRLVLLEIERHALLVAVYGDEGGGVLALLHPEAHGPPALLPGLRGSTLVTTAPMSARTWQQNGPAITCVRSRTFSFSSGNIVTRTLHLAVAYAFDCGSPLLPRAGTPPAHGAYAAYQIIVKEHRGRYPFPKSPAQAALVLHRAGSVGERPSTSTQP